jgi:DNA-binding LacI/PurR family transcriptional regulator
MSETTRDTITIADVARLAGVSTSSVSNVLNGRSKRMRPSTEERIQNAIEELGYTPNLAARQLKTGHSTFIGLIVPSVANPFYGNFARFVEEAALKRGYQVLLGNSGRKPEHEKKYAEQLWGAGVEGIIFGTSLSQYTHLEDLIKRGMHIVAFDRPPIDDEQIVIDSVCVDNLQAMRLLVRHLSALNHKRIGFVSGPIQTLSRKFRLKGYRKGLEETGLKFEQSLVWEGVAENFGDVTAVELGRQGAHHFLSKPNPPTAIITINDMYAFGVYAGARDLGAKIPDDLSVVGVDNLTLTEVVEPPLTTVEQPLRDMARIAVDRLISRMEDNCTEPSSHQTLSPKLIVRASTTRYQKK